MSTIFTIGYEKAALPDFIATLQEAGVSHVLDVRELPQSRRPGFSKRSLSEALEAVGIGYSHSKQLGDPKHGREAARRGDFEQFRLIYEAHLDLAASQQALHEALELVKTLPTVLLCYERDPKTCHRSRIVDRLVKLSPLGTQHLGVRVNAGKSSRAIEGARQYA